MKITAILFLIYGLTVLMGGVMGYLKVQSLVSLLCGLVFGLLMIAGGASILNGSSWGFTLGLSTTALLTALFAYRFFSTNKWMPAGMMMIVSAIVLIITLILYYKK